MEMEGNEAELPDAVEIFVKPGCPYCGALKRELRDDGTPFVEHDVRRDGPLWSTMCDAMRLPCSGC